METLLAGLRAAGEPTRLRLLALCAHGELSVTELTQILGQSQPRVSRHLKLLIEAGLLERFREGNLMFYRIAERAALAQQYFQENAARWKEIRAMHVAEADLENEFMQAVGGTHYESFLDIGTGTGRILELLASQVERGIGIDTSTEMLSLARTTLEQAGIKHVHVRKGDMYNLPIDDATIDLATLHLVLHYSMDPAQVLAEACRTLKPDGRLIIVDFAPHEEDALRTEHQHQRLGFTDKEIKSILNGLGLHVEKTRKLTGDPLTVNIWAAAKPPTANVAIESTTDSRLH